MADLRRSRGALLRLADGGLCDLDMDLDHAVQCLVSAADGTLARALKQLELPNEERIEDLYESQDDLTDQFYRLPSNVSLIVLGGRLAIVTQGCFALTLVPLICPM